MTQLEEEAVSFLRQTRQRYQDLPVVVSWSGGKDSTTASFIARRAFPDERIIHLFADTTIELPCTYDYMREFRTAYPAVPFLIELPARDFFALCREIGPPSRIQRWCCTTQKAAPLTKLLHTIGAERKVLVVAGLRQDESPRRQDYERVQPRVKVAQQVRISPIIEWSEFDVWAWTLRRGIPINRGYGLGLNRIGCLFCPYSPPWTEIIIETVFRTLYQRWLTLLQETAKAAGVTDPVGYVQ
ncbi:MAG: phosphoadenosine phosphosulfate reductase domain-containing protein [Candidatus Zipacnadales bacterium]